MSRPSATVHDPKRASISLTAEAFERLRAEAKRRGISMAQLVELAVAGVGP